MSTIIAPGPAGLRQSDIRLIGQSIRDRGLNPIRLDIGEPDLPPPMHVLEAARAAASTPTSYTPAAGTTGFRAAAADYLQRRHDLAVSPGDIVIGAGATGALMSCFQLMARPGDEFLVPVPGFPCYRTQIALVQGVPVGYPLKPETGWTLDVDDVASRITPRTRAIVINSPGNPTGATLPRATLQRLAEIANRHRIAIISDEVYADTTFDGPAVSASAVDRRNTFSVFSLSKTFSMTGWRVGFTVAPPYAAAALAAINSQTTASANSVGQAAAVAALTGPWDDVVHRRELLGARRDTVTNWFAEHFIPHSRPSGAFYQVLPLPQGSDSFQTAQELLELGVALVPGSAFVEGQDPFLRLSYTADTRELIAGLEIYAKHVWKS